MWGGAQMGLICYAWRGCLGLSRLRLGARAALLMDDIERWGEIVYYPRSRWLNYARCRCAMQSRSWI